MHPDPEQRSRPRSDTAAGNRSGTPTRAFPSSATTPDRKLAAANSGFSLTFNDF